jgi:CPA2 family monovalent cation:H+ antiporter-2
MTKLLNQVNIGSQHTQEKSKWKKLLTQMSINTIIYSILT